MLQNVNGGFSAEEEDRVCEELLLLLGVFLTLVETLHFWRVFKVLVNYGLILCLTFTE